jgi:S1-C subfamily serine protease
VLDGAYSTNLIAELQPGEPVRLRVLRGTDPLSITTTVGTRPTPR